MQQSSTASSSSSSEHDKRRHRHSPAQLAELNLLYEKYTHPPLEARTLIGQRIGMETKTVNAWFQNKRASSKKRRRDTGTTASTYQPPPSFDSQKDPVEDLNYQSHNNRTGAGQTLDDSDSQVRRMRMRPSPSQIDELKRLFNKTSNPSREQREAVVEITGMRYQSITNWFQNQRSVAKKRREEELEMSAAAELVHSTSRSVSPSNYDDDSPRRTSPRQGSRSSTPYSRLNNILSQRPRRSRPEPYQLDALKDLYTKSSNPTIEERTALAQEIGMDLGKVTNWFRNLRQTRRKRATKKNGAGSDDDYDDFSTRHTHSPSVSRSGSPSLHSSSSSSRHQTHSDAGSDDDYQEAVTPPQVHSQLAAPVKEYIPRPGHRMNIDMIINPQMLDGPEQHSSFSRPAATTLPSLETMLPSHEFAPTLTRSNLPAYAPPPIRENYHSKAFPNINVDDALLLLGIQAAFRH